MILAREKRIPRKVGLAILRGYFVLCLIATHFLCIEVFVLRSLGSSI
jgi:hypothetical protein